MILKRLDIWLCDQYPNLSRAYFQSLIQKGGVAVNGHLVKKRYIVAANDRIEVDLKDQNRIPTGAILPENIPLAIVHEDADILLIDKPAGIVIHPGAGNWSGTVANALLHHCSTLKAGDPHRPGIVHRLDKQTTGLLLIAKTESAHRHLSRQFAARKIKKTYLALTCRKPVALRADFAIARDSRHRKRMALSPRGRSAATEFDIVQQIKNYCLIKARPITGRTHQIRLHLSALGSPIAGDHLYGGHAPARIDLSRPLLHAWKLGFTHPTTDENLLFCAPLTHQFKSILNQLGFDQLPIETE